MISGVQNYIYFHLQKNEELWFNHLMRSEQRNNVNVWKAVYRMSTEKVLLRALRDWDNCAWWERQNPLWRVQNTWDTMVSIVEKLINGDERCLDAISYIFIMENLRLKFLIMKAEIEEVKKTVKTKKASVTSKTKILRN